MEAQRSSATTLTASVLSASSNFVHYLVSGYVVPDLGFHAYLFTIGLCGVAIGRMAGLYAAKNQGRPSLIVMALVLILTASFATMIYDLMTATVDWSTHPLCA